MSLIFGIFGKKLILKHFMHRTIPKRPVPDYFELPLYFTHTQKQKKNFHFHLPILIFWDMFLNGISLDFCKKPRNIHFDLNSVFLLSYKISFADLWSLFMECITNSLNLIEIV